MNKIIEFIADLKSKMKWDDDMITLNGNEVTVKYGRKESTQNISGYNYAYQIKLIMDMLEKVGVFE